MAVGTAALIIILSVFNGFDRIVQESMMDAKADIDIDMTSTLEQFINVKFETPDYNGKYGDVNGDGAVNANDITALYNILLGS